MENKNTVLAASAAVTGAAVTKDGDLMVTIQDDTGTQTPIFAGKIDVSEVVEEELQNYAPISAAIRPTVTGNPAVCEDSVAWGLQGLKIYGKSTQDGEPSPENPVSIVSVGEGGSFETFYHTQNLFSIKSALGGLETDNFSIEGSEDTNFTVRAKKQTIGNSIFIRVPINIPVGKTVTISGKTTASLNFRLQNRNLDGTAASPSKPLQNTETREQGYSLFATCNPFGVGDVVVQEGQTVTFSEIMVNYGDSALPWEPYKSQTITISTPNGLPGIPVESGGNFTDADGQQWICDVIDYGTGKKLQRIYKLVVDHNTTIYTASQNDLLSFAINCPQRAQKDTSFSSTQGVCKIKSMCDYYEQYMIGLVGSDKNNAFGFYNTDYQTTTLFINDRRFSSVEDYKAWLKTNPVTFLYSLETPIETDISAEELAAYRALQTYDGTTVISTAEPVAGIEARYILDGTAAWNDIQAIKQAVASLQNQPEPYQSKDE